MTCRCGNPVAWTMMGMCIVCVRRAVGLPALAAATGTAKTRNAAECEASQSGPKGNAQPSSGDTSNE